MEVLLTHLSHLQIFRQSILLDNRLHFLFLLLSLVLLAFLIKYRGLFSSPDEPLLLETVLECLPETLLFLFFGWHC